MWAVYLIFFTVMTIFFLIDAYAAAIWDLFACRAYDMLPMVNGYDPNKNNVNGNLRGVEYKNKIKVLQNR